MISRGRGSRSGVRVGSRGSLGLHGFWVWGVDGFLVSTTIFDKGL